MKPNTIILEDDGIYCFEAPRKPVMGSYYLYFNENFGK